MSELEPEDGVVTGAGERILGEGGWKIVLASIPTDTHILYPGLFLRSKLKLPRGMGYFARVCWKVKRDVVRSWILSVSWFEGHVTRGVWKMSLD